MASKKCRTKAPVELVQCPVCDGTMRMTTLLHIHFDTCLKRKQQQQRRQPGGHGGGASPEQQLAGPHPQQVQLQQQADEFASSEYAALYYEGSGPAPPGPLRGAPGGDGPLHKRPRTEAACSARQAATPRQPSTGPGATSNSGVVYAIQPPGVLRAEIEPATVHGPADLRAVVQQAVQLSPGYLGSTTRDVEVRLGEHTNALLAGPHSCLQAQEQPVFDQLWREHPGSSAADSEARTAAYRANLEQRCVVVARVSAASFGGDRSQMEVLLGAAEQAGIDACTATILNRSLTVGPRLVSMPGMCQAAGALGGALSMARDGYDEDGRSIAAQNMGALRMALDGYDEDGRSIAAQNMGNTLTEVTFEDGSTRIMTATALGAAASFKTKREKRGDAAFPSDIAFMTTEELQRADEEQLRAGAGAAVLLPRLQSEAPLAAPQPGSVRSRPGRLSDQPACGAMPAPPPTADLPSLASAPSIGAASAANFARQRHAAGLESVEFEWVHCGEVLYTTSMSPKNGNIYIPVAVRHLVSSKAKAVLNFKTVKGGRSRREHWPVAGAPGPLARPEYLLHGLWLRLRLA
ncbi:hypothetical protein C2E20_1342 [Micractinium conductrix]|uniref:UBZ4-type domain-containing protein n=1 Tax=Micractinium conductrix TaxID=554055 RepID=A0A2P6VMN2_9CHLO|nr:hypothetical protein C2E20_1342 [Micractinium conductrix]|eukprot:PSC75344.1 hypothetical protein C2E20_1342 [Micractinium conductrix]